MASYLHRNGRLGFSLACAALAAPLLLALVHVPTHAPLEDACCASRLMEAAGPGFANAETDCSICRQLDAYLSQSCVSVPLVAVARIAPHCDASVAPLPDAPRTFLPDRSGWARPPPA